MDYVFVCFNPCKAKTIEITICGFSLLVIILDIIGKNNIDSKISIKLNKNYYIINIFLSILTIIFSIPMIILRIKDLYHNKKYDRILITLSLLVILCSLIGFIFNIFNVVSLMEILNKNIIKIDKNNLIIASIILLTIFFLYILNLLAGLSDNWRINYKTIGSYNSHSRALKEEKINAESEMKFNLEEDKKNKKIKKDKKDKQDKNKKDKKNLQNIEKKNSSEISEIEKEKNISTIVLISEEKKKDEEQMGKIEQNCIKEKNNNIFEQKMNSDVILNKK